VDPQTKPRLSKSEPAHYWLLCAHAAQSDPADIITQLGHHRLGEENSANFAWCVRSKDNKPDGRVGKAQGKRRNKTKKRMLLCRGPPSLIYPQRKRARHVDEILR
ncbi:hypothetical protein CEXT_399851, partial [Caerostris extrusa]